MQITKIDATSIKNLTIKRVAAYARVSSDKDAAEHSLVQQISYYNEKISKTPGWMFAGVYADEGISGTKDTRPEFQRLLADCRAGKIDMVITKSITRFARNTVTLLETMRELKALGIDILFEKENMHSNSPDGELILTFLAMYAEEEARSASENKRWQIRKYFEEGKPTFFRIYGYDWVNGHLEINEEEAAVIRQIFDMYLSGMGRQAIARQLNKEGTTLWGKPWQPNTIYKILRNEKHTGDMLLQKSYRPDFRTKKQYLNHGQWKQYYAAGTHEPIIDRATFDAVQSEIERRKRQTPSSNGQPKGKLFAGIITCKECGSKYSYKNKLVKTSKTHVGMWICSTFLHLGKTYCSSKQIRESILIDKTREVLGLSEAEELTRDVILTEITAIESAADNRLRYFFKDGSVKEVRWENASRSKSWTPEMRQKAREKMLARNAQRKEAIHE